MSVPALERKVLDQKIGIAEAKIMKQADPDESELAELEGMKQRLALFDEQDKQLRGKSEEAKNYRSPFVYKY